MKPGKIHLIVMLIAGSALLSAFVPGKNKPIKTPEGFVFIPMGTTTIGTDTFSVQAFWMSKTEVTNKDYREYLVDLKASGNMEAYNQALPDTLQWRDKLAYNEPYVEYYFRHPAYNDYPVVNISHEQAQNYCVWLTKKMREAYGENINEVRLPTREEWVIAARGGLKNWWYPWPGEYMMDKDGRQCNYYHIGPESIHYNDTTGTYEVIRDTYYAGTLHDAADITAPVQSYKPNDYGLYNMAGNVAEMVQQSGIAVGGSWKSTGYDVRVESIQKFEGPCTTVGFRPVITYTGRIKK